MKNANLLTAACCFIGMQIIAQNTRSPVVAWYTSSGAYSKNFSAPSSLNGNVASAASIKNFGATVYGEKRFMLSEVGLYSTVIAVPTSSGNFSISANYYGYKEYNESEISVGYARKLNDKIDIGAKFNYFSVRIPLYGKASTFNFDVGAIFHITEQLHSGVNIYNPFSSRLGKNTEEKLIPVYKAGLGYEFSPSFFTSVEVIKEQGESTGIHGSFQYKPITQLFARAGVVTSSNIWYAGIGYLLKDLRFDVTVSIHRQLGISPGILLSYQVNPTNKK